MISKMLESTFTCAVEIEQRTLDWIEFSRHSFSEDDLIRASKPVAKHHFKHRCFIKLLHFRSVFHDHTKLWSYSALLFVM